jgi:hypothetical protein
MKPNPRISARTKPSINQKTIYSSAAITATAISRKLLEIKRISCAGEMTEINMALWKHLK